MKSIFDGLEKFGFSKEKLEKIAVFEKKDNERVVNLGDLSRKDFCVTDYVFEKKYNCPVCDNHFKSYTMKTGKMQVQSTDYDLRPIYKEPIQPMFYDVVICPKCGCSAITQIFNHISETQGEKIQEVITPNFTFNEYPTQLTIDMAIERYKLALLNACVRNAKNGEKAFICTKIGWLYRSKNHDDSELMFIQKAYEGFEMALQKEIPPFCGLSEPMVSYMMAAFAMRLGMNDISLKIASQLVVSPSIPKRIKDRALDLKDMIKDSKKA